MRKLVKLWREMIIGTFVALAAVAGALASYDDLRQWPTKSEHEQVAARSCKNELAHYEAELRAAKRELTQAQNEKNKNWERSIKEDIRAVLLEIDRVKRECGWH